MKRVWYAVLLALAATAQAAGPEDAQRQLHERVARLKQQYAQIDTPELAEAALQESATAEEQLKHWYAQAERACAERFFVNDCIGDLKLERREKLTVIQQITVAARTYQRRRRIEQLDAELSQKHPR